MKNNFLYAGGFLITCLLFSCSSSVNNKQQYDRARALEKSALVMFGEGEMDSTIQCYMRSAAIYKELLSHVDSLTDTTYSRRLTVVYNYVGLAYDSLKQDDKALQIDFESLKYAKQANYAPTRLYDEENISDVYRKMAKKTTDPDEQKKLYAQCSKYILAACWDIDSAGDRSTYALEVYTRALQTFQDMGDTVRVNIYGNKYYQLYQELQHQR